MICNNCGAKIGRIPLSDYSRSEWKIGACDYCSEKGYIIDEKYFGIDKKEDDTVDNLKSLFGIKK